MKISFIVPCYNVEKHVNRCIESIYNQNLDIADFEVLAINDGSTDNTLSVLKSMKYENLYVIDQTNMGLSDARNTGLAQCKGEYVWFIDSDDYIKQESAAQLIRLADDNQCDILFFGLEKIQIDGTIDLNLHTEVTNGTVISGKDAILQGYRPNSACGSLYRRVFLSSNKLQFVSKLYHEDVQFNYRAVALADKVLFSDLSPYVYEIHPNSISTAQNIEKKIKRLVDNGIIAMSFLKFAENIADKTLQNRIVEQSRSIALGTLAELKNNTDYNNLVIINSVIARFRELKLFPLVPPSLTVKRILYSCYLNICFMRYGK